MTDTNTSNASADSASELLTAPWPSVETERTLKAKIGGKPSRPAVKVALPQPIRPDYLSADDVIADTIWDGFLASYANAIKLTPAAPYEQSEDFADLPAWLARVEPVATNAEWNSWEGYVAFCNATSTRVTPAQRAAALREWIDTEVGACIAQESAGQPVSKVLVATLGALALAAKGTGPQSVSAWFSWLSAPVGLRPDGTMKSGRQVENLSASLLSPDSRIIRNLVAAWQSEPLLSRFASDLAAAYAQATTPAVEDEADF